MPPPVRGCDTSARTPPLWADDEADPPPPPPGRAVELTPADRTALAARRAKRGEPADPDPAADPPPPPAQRSLDGMGGHPDDDLDWHHGPLTDACQAMAGRHGLPTQKMADILDDFLRVMFPEAFDGTPDDRRAVAERRRPASAGDERPGRVYKTTREG